MLRHHLDATSEKRGVSPWIRFIVIGGLIGSAAILSTIALALWQSRNDAWERAVSGGENLRRSLAAHVESHIDSYQSILALAADILEEPQFDSLAASRHRMLATIASEARSIEAIVVLDAHGDIVMDSTPTALSGNFADRDYFQVHQQNPDIGTYISQPLRSRLKNDEWVITISRRLTKPNGDFGGVVFIGTGLHLFQSYMQSMAIRPNDTLAVFNEQGRMVFRQPSEDGSGDIGRDITGSPNFKRIREVREGSFVGISARDGIERWMSFAPAGDTGLMVNVAMSTKEMLAAWRIRALEIGGAALLVSAALIAFSFLLRRELYRRAEVEHQLAQLATTDTLTGLPNRRQFDTELDRQWRRAARNGKPLALLMIDADNFKGFNDRYGHGVGDRMLQLLANAISAACRRPDDFAARLGGEEFVVLLPDTPCEAAGRIAEKLRAGLAVSSLQLTDGSIPACTISIGVSVGAAGDNDSTERLLTDADKAMYRAKASGRNQVAVAQDDALSA